jgi:hypothetical protein
MISKSHSKITLTLFFCTLLSLSACKKEKLKPEEEIPPTGNHKIIINRASRIVEFQLLSSEFENLTQPNDNYYRQLYDTLKDDFDFIVEIYNRPFRPPGINYDGAAYVHSNDVTGIGFNVFNTAASAGSSGKLKSIISIPTKYGMVPYNWFILEHEILHTWANYGIQTEKFDSDNRPVNGWPHWGLSGAGEILSGFNQSTLKTNAGGDSLKYSFTPVDSRLAKYSNFELYLMGLIPIEEVTPFDVFTNLISKESDTSFRAGTRTTYNQNLITTKLGVRKPAYPDAQTNFKMLIVVFTPKPLSEDDIAQINSDAEQFSKQSADDYSDRHNFWEATYGKAKIEIDEVKKHVKQ